MSRNDKFRDWDDEGNSITSGKKRKSAANGGDKDKEPKTDSSILLSRVPSGPTAISCQSLSDSLATSLDLLHEPTIDGPHSPIQSNKWENIYPHTMTSSNIEHDVDHEPLMLAMSDTFQAVLSDFGVMHQQPHPSNCDLQQPNINTTPLFNSTPISSAHYYNSNINRQDFLEMRERFNIQMDAPPSVIKQKNDLTVTYLNKSQCYTLNLSSPSLQCADIVQSIIYLIFKLPDPTNEDGLWEYWRSCQANPNQRTFDIDRKASSNIEEIEDFAMNASSFLWNPLFGAKAAIRINCLSTEFSSQKGVRGIPLYIVMETYENVNPLSSEPTHRAYCKLQVYRDKGAERKNILDSKNIEKKLQKMLNNSDNYCNIEIKEILFSTPSQYTQLIPTNPHGWKPNIYQLTPPRYSDTSIMTPLFKDRETKRPSSNVSLSEDRMDTLNLAAPAKKIAHSPTLTIYVKQSTENVYNALLLEYRTTAELKKRLIEHYDEEYPTLNSDTLQGCYRKTKRGLIVNIDKRLIEIMSQEDDFIINFQQSGQGTFEVFFHY